MGTVVFRKSYSVSKWCRGLFSVMDEYTCGALWEYLQHQDEDGFTQTKLQCKSVNNNGSLWHREISRHWIHLTISVSWTNILLVLSF